jgi:D-alanyl-lipoteichoic acid acyltransferase DltB (MBOAT superfamily)
MHILLSPWFWAFVLASHLLRFVRVGIAPSILFGVLNLAAISVLAGRGAALLLAALAVALWVAFRGERRSRVRAISLVLTVLLGGMFVLYKLMMEQRVGPSALFLVMSALGFSYVFLRAWDVIAAVNTGRVPLLDPVSLAGYLAPFHMLPAGPITPYPQYAAMNGAAPEPPSFDGTLLALNQIATGFFYKLVIAQSIRIFAFGVTGDLVSRTWFDSALLVVYVFFDFAGYSHVARAIGTLNGVPTPINFAAPFKSVTVTEFWTRWHVSLGAFVRRNVYLPLQMNGVRRTGIRWAHLVTAATLVVAFGFVGAWHRLTGTFLLWGVGMGLIVTLEKYVRDFAWARWPWTRSANAAYAMAIVGPVYVFVVITTSLHLVMAELLGA